MLQNNFIEVFHLIDLLFVNRRRILRVGKEGKVVRYAPSEQKKNEKLLLQAFRMRDGPVKVIYYWGSRDCDFCYSPQNRQRT
jgi:hypothetical protein